MATCIRRGPGHCGRSHGEGPRSIVRHHRRCIAGVAYQRRSQGDCFAIWTGVIHRQIRWRGHERRRRINDPHSLRRPSGIAAGVGRSPKHRRDTQGEGCSRIVRHSRRWIAPVAYPGRSQVYSFPSWTGAFHRQIRRRGDGRRPCIDNRHPLHRPSGIAAGVGRGPNYRSDTQGEGSWRIVRHSRRYIATVAHSWRSQIYSFAIWTGAFYRQIRRRDDGRRRRIDNDHPLSG